MDQKQVLTILLAGMIGASAAALIGRERTQIANLVVGGVFTGLAAYYDPQNSSVLTIATAAVEGAAWGVADRVVPIVKERLLHPEKS